MRKKPSHSYELNTKKFTILTIPIDEITEVGVMPSTITSHVSSTKAQHHGTGILHCRNK